MDQKKNPNFAKKNLKFNLVLPKNPKKFEQNQNQKKVQKIFNFNFIV